jgi:protein TonB
MTMKTHGVVRVDGGFVHGLLVASGAATLTLGFFLVLPLIQAISKPASSDLVLCSMDSAQLPPPPPPPEEQPEEEPEPEEQPPQLAEEAPPLDLSQLELALNPGFSEGWMQGDFGIKLNAITGGRDDADALFSMADLDQKPRIMYQPSPVLNQTLRKKAPATVYVLFIVDRSGRVQNPIVQKSTDPVFEKPALSAVKQWKFEPGKRNGLAVRFRMRVPITFPEA